MNFMDIVYERCDYDSIKAIYEKALAREFDTCNRRFTIQRLEKP